MKEYIKYAEIYDDALRKLLEVSYFNKRFMKDFYVTNIVKLNEDKWLVKLERKISI